MFVCLFVGLFVCFWLQVDIPEGYNSDFLIIILKRSLSRKKKEKEKYEHTSSCYSEKFFLTRRAVFPKLGILTLRS